MKLYQSTTTSSHMFLPTFLIVFGNKRLRSPPKEEIYCLSVCPNPEILFSPRSSRVPNIEQFLPEALTLRPQVEVTLRCGTLAVHCVIVVESRAVRWKRVYVDCVVAIRSSWVGRFGVFSMGYIYGMEWVLKVELGWGRSLRRFCLLLV